MLSHDYHIAVELNMIQSASFNIHIQRKCWYTLYTYTSMTTYMYMLVECVGYP